MTTRIVGIAVHQNSSTGASWIWTPIVFAGAPAWIKPIGSGMLSIRYTMTAERTAMKAVTGQNPGPRFVFGLTTRCANWSSLVLVLVRWGSIDRFLHPGRADFLL